MLRSKRNEVTKTARAVLLLQCLLPERAPRQQFWGL